jgi:hypothetical protein
MDPWQIIGAAVVIVCALIGVIYWAGQHRDDKQDARFDTDEASFREHVRDDLKAHERLTVVETKVESLAAEVKALRDMRHQIIEHCTKALAEWYQKVVEMISKLK